jgi:hypothetical protein
MFCFTYRGTTLKVSVQNAAVSFKHAACGVVRHTMLLHSVAVSALSSGTIENVPVAMRGMQVGASFKVLTLDFKRKVLMSFLKRWVEFV